MASYAYTFTSGDTVTPTKLNNARTVSAIQTADISDAQITTAKIADANVTAAKLASNAVETAKILDANVTNAKLASGIDASKITTGTLPIARIADDAITNDKLSLAANAGEIKKALNADNSPPIYACRAWVNFDGATADNLGGTYTRTGTDVTITATAHGLIVGNVVRLDFTSGGALDGTYTVTQRDDANTFHVTTAASGTISTSSVTILRRLIKAAGNVSSVTYLNFDGEYVVNFSQAMPDANYIVAAGGRIRASYVLDSPAPTAQAFYLTATNTAFAGANFSSVHCAIFA